MKNALLAAIFVSGITMATGAPTAAARALVPICTNLNNPEEFIPTRFSDF